MRRLIFSIFVLSMLAAACSSSTDTTSTDTTSADATATAAEEPTTTTAPPTTTEAPPEPVDENPLGALRVPQDYATIQDAVDAAVEGDIVLIDVGVYNESVAVETDNIVIRGVDRNEVILDGEHSEEMANGIIVFSNGVAVENLTVRNYYSNGLFFTGDYDSDFVLHGWRASYVTAYNNRQYGIYAFNAEYGLADHNYASGHTDSGYYIGQCQPCMTLVTQNISAANTLGYSGTNSGGEMYVIDNEFRDNRAGIVPSTLDSEELAPQRDAVFAGNWVHGTGNLETPRGKDLWELTAGMGIVMPGTNDNLIWRNLVEDSTKGGLALSWIPDENIWIAENNEIRENVFRNNLIDAIMIEQAGTDALGNCWADNVMTTSVPDNIQDLLPCGVENGPVEGFAQIDAFGAPDPDAHIPYTDVPAPDAQPQMPDALTAAPSTADVLPEFDNFDLDAVTVPTGA